MLDNARRAATVPGVSDYERWLSTEDAARATGMSPDWIRRQIAAGRLPARVWRVGQRPTIRIRRRDLDAFIRGFSVDGRDADL
jgi:excisionase family DNA binding protein